MKSNVFCLVKTQTQTNIVVGRLHRAGLSTGRISLLFLDSGNRNDVVPLVETTTSEPTAAAPVNEGVAGGMFSLLSDTEALTLPGLGNFIASGPLLNLLKDGLSDEGSCAIERALIRFGMSEDVAPRYHGKIMRGGILICLQCDDADEMVLARGIFERAAAEETISTPAMAAKRVSTLS